MKKRNRDFPPVTPGEILEEQFLKPMGVSQYRLAKEMHVPARRINEIVKGKRAITADTALRLGRYFGTTAQLWVNLQSTYELECAEEALEAELICHYPESASSVVINIAQHSWNCWFLAAVSQR